MASTPAQKRPPTDLETRADNILCRIGRVVAIGGDIEADIIAWRKDLWALTEDKHESAPR